MKANIKNAAARRYFGTDGIRGRVGRAPMTPDFLARLGYAIGLVLAARSSGGGEEVLISKDTRLSGYMVESALEAGLAAAGINVLLSGPLPTSAVSYLTPALRLSAGIVISASHNPHHDNGVKLFDGDGKKLPDAMEAQIESVLHDNPTIAFSGAPGRARRLDSGAERYIEFCKRAFPAALNLRGLQIVTDCANGAAYHVAPPVLHELGAEVIEIGNTPDGTNINVDAGTMAPQAAARAVRQNAAALGVVLDGDGDRVMLIDETGALHDGDAVLYLIARARKRRGQPLAGVVGTVMSNMALEKKLTALGADFARAAVGDRYVSDMLDRLGWPVGGESSGHVILRDYHHTGDGILAALQVLRAMREENLALSALLAGYHPVPQQSRSVRARNHQQILQQPQVKNALGAIEKTLAAQGDMRLVVRASGTEELIRVMVEGEDAAAASEVIKQVEESIKNAE